MLIVRGSSPNDTAVFVDGTDIPMVYHFGGLSSVIPTEMLEKLDFYPGNFGPQYGRAMGGVVDVGVRSPRKDHLGGLLQFDLIDGRLLVEGPLTAAGRGELGAALAWAQLDRIVDQVAIPLDRRHNSKVDYRALGAMVPRLVKSRG